MDRIVPQSPDQLRRAAAEFRRMAETARDPIAMQELLRLAAACEQLALRAEGRREH